MTDRPVERKYRSQVRAEQATATRAAIRTAATELFLAEGYAATSMKAVARRAGVGERTVYAVFPTKSALYAHCVGVAVVGDELPIAAPDRDELADAIADPDPRAAVRRTLDFGSRLLDRAGPLIFVGLEAAASEPDLRAMRDRDAAATHGVFRRLAQRLADTGELPPGLTVPAAADIAFTLGSPHVHRLLRHERGWSSRRYRRWLYETVVTQLVSDTSHPVEPDLAPG